MNCQRWSHQTCGIFQDNNNIIQEVSVVIQLPNGDVIEHHYLYPYKIRLRGGMDNPNIDEKTSEIPYLKDQRFYWNGFPCIDFIEKIVMPLENGLATITVKGYSLLDTCKQTDAGGVLGNPARAVAPADVVDESIARNKKAFACMMNYIRRSSYFYKMAYRQFDMNGVHLLRAIRNFGTITLPPRIAKSREDTWQRMSMEALRIPMSQDGFFQWTDLVYEAGRKMNKTGQQQLDKWIDGLPSWFNTEKTAIRHDSSANLMHPATWGGMYPGIATAAVAHPYANTPSVLLFSKKYFPDWCVKSMAAGKEQGVIHSIHAVDLATYDIDDVVFLLHSSDIKEDMPCYTCGGKGHASKQLLPDGTILECPNKILHGRKTNSGHSQSSGSESKNDKLKKLYNKSQDKIAQLEEQLEAMEHLSRLHDTPSRSQRRKPHTHTAKSAASDDESFDTSDMDSHDVHDDDQSQDSESSHIADMADAIQNGKGKKSFQQRRR